MRTSLTALPASLAPCAMRAGPFVAQGLSACNLHFIWRAHILDGADGLIGALGMSAHLVGVRRQGLGSPRGLDGLAVGVLRHLHHPKCFEGSEFAFDSRIYRLLL